MVKPVNVHGIIPATVLPMTEDCKMDPASMKSYYDWLIDQGVCAVAVNVDTGEGSHLYPAEKRRVLEKSRSASGSALRMWFELCSRVRPFFSLLIWL